MAKRDRDRVDDLLSNINVVSQEEAENVDMVVCMPADSPRYFMDDLISYCIRCGVRVRHRPHVPKRPPKVCIDCAALMAEEEKGAAGLIGPIKGMQA